MSIEKMFSIGAFMYILIGSIVFGVLGKPTEMGLTIVAGALCMAFANLDKFRKFKGAGFEAEIREINEAVQEAYATVERLKKVSHPLLLTMFHQLTWGHRLGGGMQEEEKREIMQNIDDICEELEIRDPKFQQLRDEFDRLSGLDRLSTIVARIEKLPDIDGQIVRKLSALRQNFPILQVPALSEVEEILEPVRQQIPSEVEQLVKEYGEYIETTLRRLPQSRNQGLRKKP